MIVKITKYETSRLIQFHKTENKFDKRFSSMTALLNRSKLYIIEEIIYLIVVLGKEKVCTYSQNGKDLLENLISSAQFMQRSSAAEKNASPVMDQRFV